MNDETLPKADLNNGIAFRVEPRVYSDSYTDKELRVKTLSL